MSENRHTEISSMIDTWIPRHTSSDSSLHRQSRRSVQWIHLSKKTSLTKNKNKKSIKNRRLHLIIIQVADTLKKELGKIQIKFERMRIRENRIHKILRKTLTEKATIWIIRWVNSGETTYNWTVTCSILLTSLTTALICFKTGVIGWHFTS